MSKIPYDWKTPFLAALENVPVVSHAARAAGVDYRNVWTVRKNDPEFAKAWDEALEAGIDKAEQEAFRRAVVGFEEPVIHQGRLAYLYERYLDDDGNEHYRPVLDDNGQPVPLTTRKHSDSLLALILRGRRKKVYAERTEITGAEGGPVTHLDDTTRSARAAQLLAIAQARKEAKDEASGFESDFA